MRAGDAFAAAASPTMTAAVAGQYLAEIVNAGADALQDHAGDPEPIPSLLSEIVELAGALVLEYPDVDTKGYELGLALVKLRSAVEARSTVN